MMAKIIIIHFSFSFICKLVVMAPFLHKVALNAWREEWV